MRIFNILIITIIIATNAHAGGVYGTLYNKSDLISPDGNFEDERNERKTKVEKEKEQRAEEEHEKRVMEEEFNEDRRRSRR
tara:strand:+ start:9444 stop:9686 length:243 start_codon:yes stop_codon:yes gene_type:complete